MKILYFSIFVSLLSFKCFAQEQSIKTITIKISDNRSTDKNPFILRVYTDSSIRDTYPNLHADTSLHISGAPGIIYRAVITDVGQVIADYAWRFDTLKVAYVKNLILKPTSIELKTVTVHEQRQPYKRGDTLVIPVDSIKTMPHANATDLIDKIPGFSVGASGKVTALGKQVRNIKVDGVEIYGGNSKATLENIRASMLKDVEMINLDGASGSGIELNLRLKKNRREGWYGEIYGQQGTNNRNNLGLKINKIKPGAYLSAFANYNNQNQQVISPNDYLQLISSGNDETSTLGTQKLYYNFRVEDQFNALDKVAEKFSFLEKGTQKSVTAGLNYTKKYKKLSWNSYMLGNYGKTNINEFSNTVRNIGNLKEEELKNFSNLNRQLDATGESSLKWIPDAKNTVTAKLFYQKKNSNDSPVAQAATSLYSSLDSLVNESYISTHRQPISRQDLLLFRGSWEHRYERPATKTTFSFGALYNKTNKLDEYINEISRGVVLERFQNKVDQANSNYNYFGSIQHSTALGRKILLDMRIGALAERNLLDNIGSRILTDGTIEPSAALTIRGFAVTNNQVTAQGFLFYKSGPLSVVTGIGAIATNWQTKAKDSIFNKFDRLSFLPGVYVNYVLDKSKVSLRYVKEQFSPTLENLLPVADSSSVQQVYSGNVRLNPFFSNKFELNSDVFIRKFGSVNLQLNYTLTKLPVTDYFNFNPEYLFPKQTFTNFRDAQEITGTLSYFRFNPAKLINPYLFIFYLWRKQYQLNQQIVTPLEFSALSPQIGIKINFSKEHTFNLSAQSIINHSKNLSDNTSIRYNFEVRDENKIMEGLYYKASTKWILVNANSAFSSVKPIVNVNFFKYLGKQKSWQINTGFSNLLNVEQIKLLNVGLTQRSTSSYNYLARYVNLGIILYPEKWSSEK